MDFKLNINHGGDINILQITDMQVIDANQRRTPDRIDGWKLTQWVPEKNDENLYDHIRFLVKETSPDLILITGDIIYGEFDDNGSSFIDFTQFMDSFKIPWAPIFGNHDNESKMGIDWQCKQFEDSEYALFERGEVFGNGNYSIGIYQNNILLRVIFMMDSNGCGKLGIESGFRDDQLAWLKSEADAIHKDDPDLPLFVCFHIQTADFTDAYYKARYQTEEDKGWFDNFSKFEIGVDVPAQNGDFGRKYEGIGHSVPPIISLLKEIKADGVFAGHCHMTNTSVLYEGVRFTFGYKTGYYDYYDEESTGGTLIKLSGRDFSVKHIKYIG